LLFGWFFLDDSSSENSAVVPKSHSTFVSNQILWDLCFLELGISTSDS
jgi:hypothetical protein